MIDRPDTNRPRTNSVVKYICDVAELGLDVIGGVLINICWVWEAENLVLDFVPRDANSFSLHHLYDLLIQEVEIDSLHTHDYFVSFDYCFEQYWHRVSLENWFHRRDLNNKLPIVQRFTQLVFKLSNFFNKGHFLFLLSTLSF
jgi:hypothetical protein